MRSVTAKPPKILMLAITTAARPSHFELAEPAAALAISAPTMMTDEMALAEKDYIPKFMTRGVKAPATTATKSGVGAKAARTSRKTKDKGPFQA